VQFRFTNVSSFSVAPFALGKYLASGSLDMANPFVEKYFGNEETQEYIIFDVLKSTSIAVTAVNDKGADVNLDIPAIQAAVGANVTVKTGSASASEVVYEGKDQLTFGFKVFEVLFENGKWGVHGTKAGAVPFATPGAAGSTPDGVLLAPGPGMVRIK
jgi:hypothetical protein